MSRYKHPHIDRLFNWLDGSTWVRRQCFRLVCLIVWPVFIIPRIPKAVKYGWWEFKDTIFRGMENGPAAFKRGRVHPALRGQ